MAQPSDSPTAATRVNRRVLIVTDDVGGSMQLVEHLRDLSLDVTLTGYDGSGALDLPVRAPSAVLCFLSDYIEHATDIVARVRSRFAPRDLPVLGRLTREIAGDHPFDSVLYDPVHAVQVALRAASLIRLGQMEAEILRRRDTMRETFGQDLPLPVDTSGRPVRVLFIGRADPAYMAVVNALQEKNIDVVAAFTSFSAFDYLQDGEFDAVVMNALSGSEPSLTIAETMRRNPKLFQVPTLMLVDKAEFREADAAYKAGVKDLIDASSEPEEISGRVLELANTCRLHARLKTAFSHLGGEFCSDPETGVFNPAFLTAHLKRVSRDCRLRNLPLTILTIKLVPKVTSALKSGAVADALSQTIRNIADMVRMEDVVARMDKDTVIIAFPEEHRKDVARIAARITEMVETSTYPSIDTGSGTLRMAIQTAIVEQVEETSAAGEPVASRASVSA